MDERVMRIGEPGPRHSGVVQFDNWTWPGVAIQGDKALSMASVLHHIAERVLADRFTPEAREACVMGLQNVVKELTTCFRATKAGKDGFWFPVDEADIHPDVRARVSVAWIDRVARGEGCA